MRNPERFIVESLFLSLFFFSFLIRMLERYPRLTRPVTELTGHSLISDWDDVVWFCIITMSTSRLGSAVGYGDRVPKTLPARIITFFLMIWGSIWTSLFVSTLNTILSIEYNEKKVPFCKAGDEPAAPS